MISKQREKWLQVTAGQGPAECAWAVLKVVEEILREATAMKLNARTLSMEVGPESGTASSVLISLSGEGDIDAFADAWWGTVQWIAHSPFRPQHRRKNWFVGVSLLEPVKETRFCPKDVRWETMCASGPGGQHVNRTESAVRVTHLPTGIEATSSEERSQHRNKQLALARLAAKVEAKGDERRRLDAKQRWRAHQDLERGNPVRVFKADS
jgi:peptide chain release factor